MYQEIANLANRFPYLLRAQTGGGLELLGEDTNGLTACRPVQCSSGKEPLG